MCRNNYIKHMEETLIIHPLRSNGVEHTTLDVCLMCSIYKYHIIHAEDMSL